MLRLIARCVLPTSTGLLQPHSHLRISSSIGFRRPPLIETSSPSSANCSLPAGQQIRIDPQLSRRLRHALATLRHKPDRLDPELSAILPSRLAHR